MNSDYRPSLAPLGTHKAANEDHFDPAFHNANWFPAPSQPAVDKPSTSGSAYCPSTNDGFLGHSSGHAGSPSAPSQALWGPYHLGEEALVDPTFYFPDWSSAPSQTLHGSHHFTGEELPGANFDWSFTPLPVPQGHHRFAGGELCDPTLDWSSAPPLSHDGVHTAVDDGHFEPILGSVEGATDTLYDEQFNVLHEPLGINPNDAINGFWSLDDFAFTTDPTPKMTNSSGITTQRNGTAFTSPLPATQITPNAANTHSRGDRISCTHVGCSATFGRAGDFRRHIKKHADPELSCSIKTCNYKSYRLDKLREHQRKRHGIAAQLTSG